MFMDGRAWGVGVEAEVLGGFTATKTAGEQKGQDVPYIYYILIFLPTKTGWTVQARI